jgi:hypothetical protein
MVQAVIKGYGCDKEGGEGWDGGPSESGMAWTMGKALGVCGEGGGMCGGMCGRRGGGGG